MLDAINLIYDLFADIFSMLASKSVSGTPFIFIFIGAIALTMVFNLFWKGEKG